ncbi:MAG: SMP-30/gluconolactonase/LRE family protein [Bryobacterales bacterium]|nr:SMP-30/gluconolactonase/LRE family protein [Bryobacterales bacterium]
MRTNRALFLAFCALALNAQEVEIAASVSFLEGPTVDRDGNVYFTDTRPQRIMRLGTDGQLSVFRENSNGANGLVFDHEWRLVACEGGRNPRVTRTDMKTGKIEVLVDKYQGQPLWAPNDVTVDGKGRLYFTDRKGPEQGAVYRIDPNGAVTRILYTPEVEMPNGLIVSPDDRILYVVETNGREGGARRISAWDLSPQGTPSNRRVFYNFYPGRSADGITIDSEGNIWAAAGLNRRRGTHETLDTRCGIHVITPAGQVKDFIPIWEDTLTNVAFGGPDLKTLYIAAGKTLFKVRTNVAGTRR